ncbi:hypothetical protein ESCO_001220 [Escovopsis weberi]|uniref:Uncharacterized protein n=1 Tax=Escovopsis weberi TaxID=150374 RepID=A0A0M8MT77_ESCWE|nr:hypothetical protein ESCO_001220 [Escovopsis weberi]
MSETLEDLGLTEGLITVQPARRSHSPVAWIKPGSSFVEIEILSRIDDLWRYMSADDKIAEEVYKFLIMLPADCRAMDRIDKPTTSYSEIFTSGEPFKTLYAMHALTELLEATRPRGSDGNVYRAFSLTSYDATARKAFELIVHAISDMDLVPDTEAQLQVDILDSLVQMLMKLLLDSNFPRQSD